MQDSTQHTIRSTFEASNEGRIHFGQVIGQLVGAGVESYHVDYRCGRSTYFLPYGESLDLTFEKPAEGIADAFDGDAVHAAIRGAQRGEVMYPAFKTLTQRAGTSPTSAAGARRTWSASRTERQIGTRVPSSTTALPGRRKNSTTPPAFWLMVANSFSRQPAMPPPREGTTVSRLRK